MGTNSFDASPTPPFASISAPVPSSGYGGTGGPDGTASYNSFDADPCPAFTPIPAPAPSSDFGNTSLATLIPPVLPPEIHQVAGMTPELTSLISGEQNMDLHFLSMPEAVRQATILANAYLDAPRAPQLAHDGG